MAIPKYNELYRLVLLSLQDGGTHSMKEVRDFIISTLHLTEQDLAETLPSNPKSSVFSGRVGWAKTYLLKAQMIDSPQRGHIFITPSGKALLESGISITNTVLAQKCPEFLDFYGVKTAEPILLHSRPTKFRQKSQKHHRKHLTGSTPLSMSSWPTIFWPRF